MIRRGSLVRAQLDPPSTYGTYQQIWSRKNPGGLAQLGEHLLCKQGVVGSIPSSSTNHLSRRSNDHQHQSSLETDFFVVDSGLPDQYGCSLKIHRVEISVVSGKQKFVKVLLHRAANNKFDCVKTNRQKLCFIQVMTNRSQSSDPEMGCS